MRAESMPARQGVVRRIRAILADLRLEIAVVSLLLLTVGAIHFSDRILDSTITFQPSDSSSYETDWHGDEAVGGMSTITADARRPLRWSCELRAKYQYPFCGYEVLFDKWTNRGLDLRHFQTLTLTIDYRGSADSVRLYLKNYDRHYSKPTSRETVKFNQIELPIRHRMQVMTARLADFDVAEWWVQKNHVPFRYSRPQFDNIVALEIETGNGTQPGRHDFRITSITLHGSRFTIEQWYLGILAFWIVLICLFLIARIIDLQRDLRRKHALQDVALQEARRAQESARRDHLTGLLNRLGMTDRYQQMAAAGGGKPVAIMLVDVDHFKSINDRFGHVRGDEVLVAFAEVLRSNLRDDDLIGRWGGEEFLLIARVGDEHAAIEIANKLRAVIERADFGIEGGLTASFGVHYCEALPDNIRTAVSRTDRALYAAKEQGRNRVVLYQPPAEQELVLSPAPRRGH